MANFFKMIFWVIASTISSADASTLAWNAITGYGPTLGHLQAGHVTPNDLFGTITGLYIETNVLDDWTFDLSDSRQVRITVNSLAANTGSLLYAVNLDGIALAKSPEANEEAWLFDHVLAAGSHTINVVGIATSLQSTSGYQINVAAASSVVPVPAVGWMFGLFCFTWSPPGRVLRASLWLPTETKAV